MSGGSTTGSGEGNQILPSKRGRPKNEPSRQNLLNSLIDQTKPEQDLKRQKT